MKKITTILMLLMLTCMGAKAQVISKWSSDLVPVTKDAVVASAGSGARYAFRMPSNTKPGWCDFVNVAGALNDLSDAYLFTIELGSGDGKYKLKRVSDGQFLSGNAQFNDTGMDLTLTNRIPKEGENPVSDYDTGYSESTPFVSFDNDGGAHYNCGNGSGGLQFRGGTGGWSVYVAYGPIWIVTVDCQENGASLEGYPQTQYVVSGGQITAPEFLGKTVLGTDKYTINEDQTITFNYGAASSFDYTLVVNGAPEGTTITIKGEPASAGAVSFDSEVTESDVAVTFPTGYDYMTYTVTVEGTTITVTCYDPRWPVNFDKSVRSTHSQTDRSTRTITLDGQTINVPGQAEEPPIIYNDCTNQSFTVGAGAVVTPSFGYNKNWMHGFVYIDLNNDGDFTDDGELVAKSPTTGSPNLATDVAAFTLPGEGTYRMRWKVDWANEDPGGTGPGNNYIASNGGAVIDVTLTVVGAANVTFKVLDANNNPLLEETVSKAVGEVISELPSSMQRSFTSYTYPDGNLTVTSGGDNVFKAVATFNLPFTPFTNFADATWYYVTLRGSKYVRVTSNEPYDTSNTNGETEEYQWTFSGNPYTGVKMYNKTTGEGKTVTKDGDNPVLRDGEYTWEILDNLDGFVLKAPGTANWYINNSGGQAKFGSWNSTLGREDNGGTFRLTKVPETPVTYITALENLSNDKVYTVHNTPRAMWMFTEKALAADPLSGVNIYDEVANPAAKHQIAIVKQNDKYYLYSVAQKKYLAAGNKLYNSPLEAVEIIESTAKNGNYMWFFLFEGYTDRNINTNGTPAIEINWWDTHDFGNTNAIMETNATYTVADALAAFTDYTQCITDYCDYKGISADFVNHLDEMGYPKAGTIATTAFTEVMNRNTSGENTADDWSTFVTKYEAVLASDNIKMPEVGNFYRIKGVAGGRYMQSTVSTTAEDGKVGTRLGATADADASTIFYLDTNNKLLGFSNGMYVTNTCDFNSNVANNSTGATQFTFVPRAANGTFAVKNGNTFLYSWDGETNYCVDRQGSDHANCVLTIEEVTELPITLREAECKDGTTRWFATFSAPVAVSEVVGAEIHKVTDMGNSVKVEPANVTGIPAGTAVLLVSETAPTESKVIIGATDAEITTVLSPLYACEEGKAGLFFGKGGAEGYAGFYKLNPDTKTGGFKAYIAAEGSGAKMLDFGNEATGIDTVENSVGNGAVYNLQGQRVNKAQKGVFIQNGKKVVLK